MSPVDPAAILAALVQQVRTFPGAEHLLALWVAAGGAGGGRKIIYAYPAEGWACPSCGTELVRRTNPGRCYCGGVFVRSAVTAYDLHRSRGGGRNVGDMLDFALDFHRWATLAHGDLAGQILTARAALYGPRSTIRRVAQAVHASRSSVHRLLSVMRREWAAAAGTSCPAPMCSNGSDLQAALSQARKVPPPVSDGGA